MTSEDIIKKFKNVTHSGEIYDSADKDFEEYQHELVAKVFAYNHTSETKADLAKREQLLKEMVGTYGEDLCIMPPVNANCGLSSVHFGNGIYINCNCNFVDDGEISFGDDCMVGPNVTFATAAHPISPKLRKAKLQYNKPIHIGKNVWIGASATILPGVTIGDDSIVGAGSIVTKDVPAKTIAVGNPAKKLRSIDEKDDFYYDNGKKVPQAIIDKYL